jgi:hypothetical protein
MATDSVWLFDQALELILNCRNQAITRFDRWSMSDKAIYANEGINEAVATSMQYQPRRPGQMRRPPELSANSS